MTLPTGLQSFNKIYPLMIKTFENFSPLDYNVSITDKVNSMIDYLNQVGALTNDTVANWNKVMYWAMNDGLDEATTQSVNAKMESMLAAGDFDDLLQSISTLAQQQIDLLNTNTGLINEQIDLINANQVAKKGSGATVIIASSTASALEKANANFVCTGTNDEVTFAQAIDSLPKFSFHVVGGTYTAACGKVLLSTGIFHFGTMYAFPNAVHLVIQGAGRCYQDLAFGGSGGTIIAGTDPNGVLDLPFITAAGDNQTIVLRDLDIRQDAVQVHNGVALNMRGLMSGGLENIGVINDKNISGVQCQDGHGLSLNNGSLGNTCWASHIDVGSFGGTAGRYNLILASNHFVINDVHLNGGSTYSNGLQVDAAGDRINIGDIHFFGFGTSSSSGLLIYVVASSSTYLSAILQIKNLSYESINALNPLTTPFIQFADSKSKLIIDRINGNSSVDCDILYNARSQVSVGQYVGTHLHPAKGGFTISTPSLPALLAPLTNTHPYPVLIYLVGMTGNVHVTDESNQSRNLGSLASVLLPPNFSVYFENTLPSSWYWCGI